MGRAVHDFPELPLEPPTPQPGRPQRGTGAALGAHERLTAATLRILPSTEPTYGVLDEVLALRRRHWERGHTPESDAAHGPLFFLNGAEAFLRQADAARTRDKARRHRIAAIAMLVALIDREDFLSTKEDDGDAAA